MGRRAGVMDYIIVGCMGNGEPICKVNARGHGKFGTTPAFFLQVGMTQSVWRDVCMYVG